MVLVSCAILLKSLTVKAVIFLRSAPNGQAHPKAGINKDLNIYSWRNGCQTKIRRPTTSCKEAAAIRAEARKARAKKNKAVRAAATKKAEPKP
jgi:hypothetical protein